MNTMTLDVHEFRFNQVELEVGETEGEELVFDSPKKVVDYFLHNDVSMHYYEITLILDYDFTAKISLEQFKHVYL